MKKAKRKDKSKIISLLAQSFEENQSVNFIVGKGGNKLKRIYALMDYSYEICAQFGEVLLSDDGKACALLLFPHLKRLTLKSIWLDIKLIFQTIGITRLRKAINRETQIKKLQPKAEMAYLWFIGVDPQHQHLGIGSKLFKEVLAEAKLKNLPVYLETSTLQNLPWYERFGFHIYHKLELGYTLYFLNNL